MSHTPGPWKRNELSPRAIMTEDGKLVGDVLATRCEEDMDLLAAAPCLLSACQEALKLFGNTDAPIVHRMRAAVAKATGKVE